jgi:chromate reductase
VIRIVGISGSLRTGSFNAALLRAAAERAPEGSEIVVESIRGVPLYDADVEAAEGIPPAVERLKQAVIAADGLLLVTPEYNNSVPGVFKNAIDWMSRPPADIPPVFGDKPVGMIGASRGSFGTTLSQTAWLPVLRTLGTDPWFGMKLLVGNAATVFEDGKLASEEVERRLRRYLDGFVAHVRRRGGS